MAGLDPAIPVFPLDPASTALRGDARIKSGHDGEGGLFGGKRSYPRCSRDSASALMFQKRTRKAPGVPEIRPACPVFIT